MPDMKAKVLEIKRLYPELHPYTISLKVEVVYGIKIGANRVKQILAEAI